MLQKVKNSLHSPAYQLIIETAKKNWILLSINLCTNLFSAVLEGSTLGIIYLAISLLSKSGETSRNSAFIAKFIEIVPLPQNYLFIFLLAAAVILQLLLALSNFVNKVSSSYLSARAQPLITSRVFRQIASFSFPCASQYKVGDLIYFVNDAAGTVDRQIAYFNNFIVSSSFALVYGIIIFKLSSFLALAAVALSLAVIVVQRQLLPRIRKASYSVNSVQVELSKQMTESIQALRLLHTFGTQSRAIAAIDRLLIDVKQALEKKAILDILAEPIFDILPILSLAILATLAYLFSDNSQNILPLLLTFLLALQRLAIRIRGVSGSLSQFAGNSANISRLNNILIETDKQFEIVGGEPFRSLKTNIDFKNVSLSYNNDQEFALQNLTFTIPKNQVTALVGQSGAGKSSIVDLLVGLYQPTLGEINVNGKPISSYEQSSWRKHIGIVSQDTFIFNTSILENLRYGVPNSTIEEVIEASKAAQSHDFIVDLPNKYDTIVGERGYRLSGGQRQRLALARAIIKKPEILILDEATSALDSHSELLIQEALEQFQKNRTVIIIAHRLSTIVNADQILVLEKGQVIECGSHLNLIQQGGRYANYWKLQTVGRFKDWQIEERDKTGNLKD